MKPAACRRPCRHRSCSFGLPITDTYTLACCRSPDTSARVTVTPLTRGSRSSNRIVWLATSRTASATRANRCVFMVRAPWGKESSVLLHVEVVAHQLGHRVAPQRLDDLLQGGADMAGLVAHHRESQDRHLAVVQRPDLGHRHVEPVAQPVLDAAHHLPLVLEGPRLPD